MTIAYTKKMIVLILLILSAGEVLASDPLNNRRVLSLPLTDHKLVIAHNMTNIIRYKGHRMEDSCDPTYYSPRENITAALGGLTQVLPMSALFLADSSLEAAVEFEIRAAMQSGIDGFQFYYTLGGEDADKIILTYLNVATKKQLDFKFTFCISHPSGSTEASRINRFATRMNLILDQVGRSNPHWLRTPDGRLILYTWYGETLADTSNASPEQPAPLLMARAYNKLEQAVKDSFAVVLSINEFISVSKLNSYLDYFPAVWLWTLPYSTGYIGEMVWKECSKRKREFTGSAFPGFYTSKLLKKGTWEMYHTAAGATSAGIEKTERKYIVTGLSENFRKQWEFAIAKDVSIMNIITWNDYPEGHHLAPEINHNDGFSLLLLYYRAQWKNLPTPFGDRDILITFYKKYNRMIDPSPYNIPVIQIEKPGTDPGIEDSIEVVTILPNHAEIRIGKQVKEAGAGLQSTRFTATAGKVRVELKRNGTTVERIECPEWITINPYRTDRITYSFSNQTDEFYKKLFNGPGLIYSTEYDPGSPVNHINSYSKPDNRH
ncbi:MAG: endo-1,3-alpha-glucanase family glycosylhydrolase [Chitinophagaceae bacterium]